MTLQKNISKKTSFILINTNSKSFRVSFGPQKLKLKGFCLDIDLKIKAIFEKIKFVIDVRIFIKTTNLLNL